MGSNLRTIPGPFFPFFFFVLLGGHLVQSGYKAVCPISTRSYDEPFYTFLFSHVGSIYALLVCFAFSLPPQLRITPYPLPPPRTQYPSSESYSLNKLCRNFDLDDTTDHCKP